MKVNIIVVICYLLLSGVYAQKCPHTNLSDKFDLTVHTKWYGSKAHILGDSLDVKITITKKNTKVEQHITLGSSWMLDDAYSNCSNVRSYTTAINKNGIAQDNNYGDIIVADFNFDNRDDIAFKRNAGGNGGPPYLFYVQNEKGLFILDMFLTEIMEYFPSEIDTVNHKLVTLVHSNTYSRGKTTYKYFTKIKKWKQVSLTYVPY